MSSWFVVIPWIWAALLLITAIINLVSMPKALRNVFKVGAKEVVAVRTSRHLSRFQMNSVCHDSSE